MKSSSEKKIKYCVNYRKKDNGTYVVWSNMKQRCLNPKNTVFKTYGGRGIFVCEKWMIYENFLQDMGIRPDNLVLSRLNVNDGYYKENCKWDIRLSQILNRRKRSRSISWKNKDTIFKKIHLRLQHIVLCKELNLLFKTSKEAADFFKVTRECIRQCLEKRIKRLKRKYTLIFYNDLFKKEKNYGV